jgi:hypothetical protein
MENDHLSRSIVKEMELIQYIALIFISANWRMVVREWGAWVAGELTKLLLLRLLGRAAGRSNGAGLTAADISACDCL